MKFVQRVNDTNLVTHDIPGARSKFLQKNRNISEFPYPHLQHNSTYQYKPTSKYPQYQHLNIVEKQRGNFPYPTGDSIFINGNKKHYYYPSTEHASKEIAHTDSFSVKQNLIDNNFKDINRNLNTYDIPGAQTGTINNQVVKNQSKHHELVYKANQQQNQHIQPRIKSNVKDSLDQFSNRYVQNQDQYHQNHIQQNEYQITKPRTNTIQNQQQYQTDPNYLQYQIAQQQSQQQYLQQQQQLQQQNQLYYQQYNQQYQLPQQQQISQQIPQQVINQDQQQVQQVEQKVQQDQLQLQQIQPQDQQQLSIQNQDQKEISQLPKQLEYSHYEVVPNISQVKHEEEQKAMQQKLLQQNQLLEQQVQEQNKAYNYNNVNNQVQQLQQQPDELEKFKLQQQQQQQELQQQQLQTYRLSQQQTQGNQIGQNIEFDWKKRQELCYQLNQNVGQNYRKRNYHHQGYNAFNQNDYNRDKYKFTHNLFNLDHKQVESGPKKIY